MRRSSLLWRLTQMERRRRSGPSSSAPTGEIELIGTQISSANPGKPNLLASPQYFTDPTSGTWTNTTNLTLADGLSGSPDGGSNASSFTETVTNGLHRVRQRFPKAASSRTYDCGIYVKQGLRTRVVVDIDDASGSNGVFAAFDVAGGQVGVVATTYGTGFSSVLASITSVGNGWYRCNLRATTNSTANVDAYFGCDNGSGTGALSQSYAGNTGSVALNVFGAYLIDTVATANVLANLIDGDITTWWEDFAYDAWAGYDAGVGKQAVFTGALIMPRSGDATQNFTNLWYDYPLACSGAAFQLRPKRIEYSDDPAFVSGVNVGATLSRVYPRFDLNEIPFSGTARCARAWSPYGQMAELRFIAQASASLTDARPMRPTISPWGGLFPAGATQVTIASRTTSALIYYTTDGTTPDNTKTLYAGAFTLTISSDPTTLKAVAYEPLLGTTYSAITTATFRSHKIKPLEDWYDNRGILIEAHGGDLIESGSYIYWVGTSSNVRQLSSTMPRSDYGVQLYRCTNNQGDAGYLKHWEYVGQILEQPANAGVQWAGLQRCHIRWNANTSKFVLIGHLCNVGLTVNKCAIAESASIESGWSWINTNFDPGGVGFKDCNLYTNAAGTSGYLVYTDGAQANLMISQLDSDFHSATSTITAIASDREAPVLFDNGTNLFLITSKSYAYNAAGDADVKVITLSGLDPMGSWPSFAGTSARVFNTNPAGGNYLRSQSSAVFKPVGKSDYILLCDLWMATSDLYTSRQAWSPLTISASSISATQPSEWDIGDLA